MRANVGAPGGCRIQKTKERGEWAELVFMTRAAEHGLHITKPYGDSTLYDVAIEHAGHFLRVQVKSTNRLRGGEDYYVVNIVGPKHNPYPRGSFEFFALYLIPIDTWYIIPYWTIGRTRRSINITPARPCGPYEPFREAWHLFKCGACERDPCAGELCADTACP